eukprot:6479278-Alexandrium_andersonii.AAC.1
MAYDLEQVANQVCLRDMRFIKDARAEHAGAHEAARVRLRETSIHDLQLSEDKELVLSDVSLRPRFGPGDLVKFNGVIPGAWSLDSSRDLL